MTEINEGELSLNESDEIIESTTEQLVDES